MRIYKGKNKLLGNKEIRAFFDTALPPAKKTRTY